MVMATKRKPRRANKYDATLKKQLTPHVDLVLEGRLLAVDPSSGGSSDPGYAYYVGGELQDSGTVEVDGRKKVERRLRQIYLALFERFAGRVDILVVEKIRGARAPAQLQWSVGVIMAACCVVDDQGQRPAAIELPISTWKRYAKQIDEYEKGDEADAIVIGLSLIQEAKLLKGDDE